MNNVRFRPPCALLTLLLVGVVPALPAAEIAPASSGNCKLIIDGKFVETVAVEARSGEVRIETCLDGTVALPPGEYRVQQVILKGNHSCYISPAEDAWFTARPDHPHRFQAGAPLQASVQVARQGRMLVLDYQLTDAAGHRYNSSSSSHPPQFTIRDGDQEIGSGVFEYG